MPVRGPRCSAVVAVWAIGCVFAVSPAAAQTLTKTRGRKLAPDILKIIPPGHELGDTVQGPVDLPYVGKHPELVWSPNHASQSSTLLERSKNIKFRGDASSLEFAFKPVRMIDVEISTPAGFRTKRIWYMVYRVRYLGLDHSPKQIDNNIYETQSVSATWVRFFPQLHLEPKGLSEPMLDQIIYAAKAPIARRERIGSKLYDSVEMQAIKIKLSTETEDNAVWGLATWTDVSPQTDFFTIQVRGISNAQKLEQVGDEYKHHVKTLELFFSRPGDTIDETKDRIRYGIPALTDSARQKHVLDQFGVQERLDYRWIYR